MKNYPGAYTNLRIAPSHFLQIELTAEGRAYLSENRECLPERDDAALLELMEEHMTNDAWEEIKPEEIGAMTSALLLAYAPTRDDHGQLQSVRWVYKWDAYALRLYIEELMEMGSMWWIGSRVDYRRREETYRPKQTA